MAYPKQSDPQTGKTIERDDLPGIPESMAGRGELARALEILATMMEPQQAPEINLPRMEVPEYGGPKPWVKKASGIIDSLMAVSQAYQAGKDREEGFYPMPVTGGGYTQRAAAAEERAQLPIQQAEAYNLQQAGDEARMRMEAEQNALSRDWSRENVILNQLLPSILREPEAPPAVKPPDVPEELQFIEYLNSIGDPERQSREQGLLFPKSGGAGGPGGMGEPELPDEAANMEWILSLPPEQQDMALRSIFPPPAGRGGKAATPTDPRSLFDQSYFPAMGENLANQGEPAPDPQTFKDYQKEYNRLMKDGVPMYEGQIDGPTMPISEEEAIKRALDYAKKQEAMRRAYFEQTDPQAQAGGGMGQSIGAIAAQGLLGGAGGAPGQPPGQGPAPAGMPQMGGAPAPQPGMVTPPIPDRNRPGIGGIMQPGQQQAPAPPQAANQGPMPSITNVDDPWAGQSEELPPGWSMDDPAMQPALPEQPAAPEPTPQAPQPGRSQETYPSTPLQPWDGLPEVMRVRALRGVARALERGEDIEKIRWQFYQQYGKELGEAYAEFEQSPEE